jgi:tetratricopeptide (TPR) repeat protein
MYDFDKQVERNLKGIELEKSGRVDEAIQLYEENVKENFEGSHPYDRLAIIYRKRNMIDDEIRVLEKAIWVFENIVHRERLDKWPKLEKFKKRLEKAKKLKSKQYR